MDSWALLSLGPRWYAITHISLCVRVCVMMVVMTYVARLQLEHELGQSMRRSLRGTTDCRRSNVISYPSLVSQLSLVRSASPLLRAGGRTLHSS